MIYYPYRFVINAFNSSTFNRCLRLFAQKWTSQMKRSRRFRCHRIPSEPQSNSSSPGNPGNQHERNQAGGVGCGGRVRDGGHDGAQLHAQHQDDLRQAVQCQLRQDQSFNRSSFMVLITSRSIKCAVVDHGEGSARYLRG